MSVRATFRLNGTSRRSCTGSAFDQRWTWQSIIPGMTVSAEASITCAPLGEASPKERIAPSSIRTVTLRLGSAPVPSMRAPQRTATVVKLS